MEKKNPKSITFQDIERRCFKWRHLEFNLICPCHLSNSLEYFISFILSPGALNTVGRYIVNMTRGQETSITNHNPSENVPNAILTLTKNVLGQNVTKNMVEPVIKRFSVVETRDDPEFITTTAASSINENLPLSPDDIYLPSKIQSSAASLDSIDSKKKRATQKQKTKRKEQQQQQNLQKIELISDKRKILIF